MVWQPPQRPTWALRLIEHGEAVGGPGNLVSLELEELLETARRSTGLSDFGGEDWLEHCEVFVRALEDESDLHLAGRVLANTQPYRIGKQAVTIERV